VIPDLKDLAAACYLAASVAAAFGLLLPSARAARLAVAGLVLGALLHGGSFWQIHAQPSPPPLTDLAMAVSLTAWIGTGFYLLLLLRVRGRGLAVLVAPLAFLGIVVASVTPSRGSTPQAGGALWPHLHVLLASAGLALVGVAGAAGLLYLAHHRRIKAKRRGSPRTGLPSLEALDRVNTLSLSLGFLLLSLGVLTGMAWVHAATGRLWPGNVHANATLAAWLVYAGMVAVRFGSHQGARRAAVTSAAGFALLLTAVVGIEVLS
jgi:ABC-type uncharacterized transport system permease subunit